MSNQIKTFNSGKLYAEEVLHPLLKKHSDARNATKLGAISIEEANKLTHNLRMIGRFNALKERSTYQQTLINEISATVSINGSKEETDMLKNISKNLDRIDENYENSKDDILVNEHINGEDKLSLTNEFNKINSYLDKLYIQIQRIMTKNKLLFTGDNNDFLDDQDLKEKIKRDNLMA